MRTQLLKNKSDVDRSDDVFLSIYKKQVASDEAFSLKRIRKASWEEMKKMSWNELDREDWRYTKYDTFFPDEDISIGSCETGIRGLTEKDISSGVKAFKSPGQMDEDMSFIQDYKQVNSFYSHDKWTLLNSALFNQGVFIEIPENYETEGTLHIEHFYSDDGLEIPLTYVKLNRGSRLNIVEEYFGGMNTTKHVISNIIIELAPGSKLNHIFIQNLSGSSKGLFYQNVFLDRDAELQTHSIQLGSKEARIVQNIELTGEGSFFRNYGLLYGRGKQHLDIQTTQIHKAPNTGGEVLYRHVVKDSAKSIFKGKVVIERDNPFCNATQKNENLLLSEKAEAISLPKLEILNNEVQCSHGATISTIDEDQLFYLTSRGIELDDARKMIVEGFFEDILKKINVPAASEIISKKVKELL